MTNGMDWMEPPPQPRRQQRSDADKAGYAFDAIALSFVIGAVAMFGMLNPVAAAMLLLLAAGMLQAKRWML